MAAKLKATGQTRAGFTAHYVAGAVLLARRAEAIETSSVADDEVQAEHRALIVGAIMQSAAALETELSDIMLHGPGHHLGSNGLDAAAHAFLEPLEPIVDRQSGVLNRWETVLHLLRKPAMNRSHQTWENAELLVSLRNELVHHKSQWGGAVSKKTLVDRLMAKKHAIPHWVMPGHNDFPFRVLVADCAHWAAKSAAGFIDIAYAQLGVPGLLNHFRTPGGAFERILPSPAKPVGKKR